jgi:hypothetical protein
MGLEEPEGLKPGGIQQPAIFDNLGCIQNTYSEDGGHLHINEIVAATAFPTLNQTLESVFESERVFRNFRNSILTSFFCNFWKVWNRTISKFSVIWNIWKPLFLTLKQEIISKLISELFFQNF